MKVTDLWRRGSALQQPMGLGDLELLEVLDR